MEGNFNIPSDPFLRQYALGSMSGIATGMPTADMFLNMFLGQYMSPRPPRGAAQSVYDTFLLKSQSADMMQAGRHGFASSLLARKLGGPGGMDPNSTAMMMLSPFLATPDSIGSRMLSPLMGGNPVAAQMGLRADLQGLTMGAFGTVKGIDSGGVQNVMDNISRNFYTHRNYTPVDLNRDLGSILKRGNQIGKDLPPEMMRDFESALYSGKIQAFIGKHGTGTGSELGSTLENAVKDLKALREDTSLSATDRQTKIDEVNKNALEFSKKLIDNVTDPDARMKMVSSFSEALKKGEEGVAQWKKMHPEATADVVRLLRGAEVYRGQVGKDTPMGINYFNSRGFNIEDITGAFGASAMYRLTGRKGIDAASTAFGSTATPVLDALRGMFGNDKSGKELTQALHGLLGTSTVDLTDDKSAKGMEKLLYNVKGAARTAGVSIEAMVSMIGEFKKLAESTSGTELMGGIDIMKASVNVMNRTTAAASYMDPTYVRMMGGPQGMYQRGMIGEIQGRAQPIAQQLGALYEYFSQRGDSKSAGFIGDAVTRGTNLTRYGGYSQFLGRLSSMSGMNMVELSNFADSNPMLAQMGQNRMTENGIDVSRIASQAMIQESVKAVGDQYAASPHGRRLGGAFMSLALNSDMSLNGSSYLQSLGINPGALSGRDRDTFNVIMRKRAAGVPIRLTELPALMNLRGKFLPEMFSQMQNMGYDNQLRAAVDPEFASRMHYVEGQMKNYTSISQDLAAQYGHLNAGLNQNVINNLMSGGLNDDGISGLTNGIKDNGARLEVEKHLKNVRDLGFGPGEGEADHTMVSRMNKLAALHPDSTGRLATGTLYGLNDLASEGMTADQIRRLKDPKELAYYRKHFKGNKKISNVLNSYSEEALSYMGGWINELGGKNVTGTFDIFKLAQQQELDKASGVQLAAREKLLGGAANQEYQNLLQRGSKNSDFRNALTGEITALQGFGVIDAKGTLDVKKYLELSKSDDKFKAHIKGVTGVGGKAFYKGIGEIADHYNTTMDAAKGAKETEQKQAEMATTMDSLANAMKDLVKAFADDGNVTKALAALTTAVNNAVK